MKQKINLIFRKPSPAFNSIENVFNAIVPYIKKEFVVNQVHLPYRTTGVSAMRKNIRFVISLNLQGLTHITGHENYIVKAFKDKTILTVHDLGSASVGKPLRDYYINRNWFKLPLRKADIVTVISSFSEFEMQGRYPFVKEKTRVVPNPVDDHIIFSPYEFNSEKPSILQVGTKSNKNIENTLKAIRGINCRLYILGELSIDQKELLSDMGIEYENLVNLDYEKVIGLYREVDMVLFSSFYEGFGMPILEAQATGRPVITSNISAMPETAGEGAAIVDPYDVDDIRGAVLKIIQDKEYREEIVQKGLENVKAYRAESIAKKYMDIYKELL